MIKITIEGPMGSGKSCLSRHMALWLFKFYKNSGKRRRIEIQDDIKKSKPAKKDTIVLIHCKQTKGEPK